MNLDRRSLLKMLAGGLALRPLGEVLPSVGVTSQAPAQMVPLIPDVFYETYLRPAVIAISEKIEGDFLAHYPLFPD